MAKSGGLIEQYQKIKANHRDALLFFRLGDFYELFNEDAEEAAKILGLTLTARELGGSKIAMCGMPHHAAQNYIKRLVKAGRKVALCEQIEGESEPSGIILRRVVRIITAGTIFDEDDSKNRYIMAVFEDNSAFGLAYADVATGEFNTAYTEDFRDLLGEAIKLAPCEIIVNNDKYINELAGALGITPEKQHLAAFLYDESRAALLEQFGAGRLAGFGITNKHCISAAGALMRYLYRLRLKPLPHFVKLREYSIAKIMILDKAVRKNLELAETQRGRAFEGSLLWVMDRTKTAMGGRLLRKWLENPLLEINDILTRQDAVAEYYECDKMRHNLRHELGKITDLERLCAKLSLNRVTHEGFLALKASVQAAIAIRDLLAMCQSSLNAYFAGEMDVLADVCEKIDCIEGKIIGPDLDALRMHKNRLLEGMTALVRNEREQSGIKSLKLGQNKGGHYFEISNSHRGPIPANFQQSQALTNSTRYTSDELKQLNADFQKTTERISYLERELLALLKKEIVREIPRIMTTAGMVATIDALQSLGEIAKANNYCRPNMVKDKIHIKNGRHPVVERVLGEPFVPNDTYLDNQNKIAILTGPNMAGKSTYLRQVALICIMAQMGSFVPAESAAMPVCDRIFARIGAYDDISHGRSAFMVEMNEMANILNNATQSSLILLDEVCSATGTEDGYAIALAILEHIAKEISAKTLIATHFHQLAKAHKEIPGITNYSMAVNIEGENVIFLRKVVGNSVGSSSGILVARLAGLPSAVIERSGQIQKDCDAVSYDESGRPRRHFRLFLDELGDLKDAGLVVRKLRGASK